MSSISAFCPGGVSKKRPPFRTRHVLLFQDASYISPESVPRAKKAASTSQPNKQSLKKTRRNKKKKWFESGRNQATVKGKGIKSAVEEYRKRQAVDHFQENLQYMMSSQFITDNAVTQKVLAQNRGRKARDRPQEEAKKKPEGTVFTEEDFQQFEREYFGGAAAV